jgi:hypothetical protein
MKETTIAAITPELDTLAAEAMAEWKVPGMAIAIVQEGETALLNAYGQRDVEAGLPVTTRTQFTICSITKTFTATDLQAGPTYGGVIFDVACNLKLVTVHRLTSSLWLRPERPPCQSKQS